ATERVHDFHEIGARSLIAQTPVLSGPPRRAKAVGPRLAGTAATGGWPAHRGVNLATARRLVRDGQLAEEGPVVLRDREVDDPRRLHQVRWQRPLCFLEVRRGNVRSPCRVVAERLDEYVLLGVG